MANTPKPSIKFYSRHKTRPKRYWRELSYEIIVSYNKKRLRIPGGHYSTAIWWDEFTQIDSNGLPLDTENPTPEALDLSKRLQATKEYYLTALNLVIKNGKWETMTSKEFALFLFTHEVGIRNLIAANKSRGGRHE